MCLNVTKLRNENVYTVNKGKRDSAGCTCGRKYINQYFMSVYIEVILDKKKKKKPIIIIYTNFPTGLGGNVGRNPTKTREE